MIVDGGAEMLLAAVYAQALADLEDVYRRVTMLRRACAAGRLERFVATNGAPLATEDERTAVWWYEDRPWLPKELASMVAAVFAPAYYLIGDGVAWTVTPGGGGGGPAGGSAGGTSAASTEAPAARTSHAAAALAAQTRLAVIFGLLGSQGQKRPQRDRATTRPSTAGALGRSSGGTIG